jgi:hypothetical protein
LTDEERRTLDYMTARYGFDVVLMRFVSGGSQDEMSTFAISEAPTRQR